MGAKTQGQGARQMRLIDEDKVIEALEKENELLKNAQCTKISVCRDYKSKEYQRMCYEPKKVQGD